jgi:hypothetical protein
MPKSIPLSGFTSPIGWAASIAIAREPGRAGTVSIPLCGGHPAAIDFRALRVAPRPPAGPFFL